MARGKTPDYFGRGERAGCRGGESKKKKKKKSIKKLSPGTMETEKERITSVSEENGLCGPLRELRTVFCRRITSKSSDRFGGSSNASHDSFLICIIDYLYNGSRSFFGGRRPNPRGRTENPVVGSEDRE